MKRRRARHRKPTRLRKAVNAFQDGLILKALRAREWNFSVAARALGVKRSWLYALIRKSPSLHRAWKTARGQQLHAR